MSVLPDGTVRLDMARIDRAKIRAAVAAAASPLVGVFGGMELRVNAWMPEGILAAFDAHGNLLGLIDVRGDHDPSTKDPTL
jgi:hypothetical protein